MIDIVDRLRSVTRLLRETDQAYYDQDDTLADDAAREVGLLRLELMTERECSEGYHEAFFKCEEEKDRLKQALHSIVREWEAYFTRENSGDVPYVVALTMVGIARAALEGLND